MRKIAFPILLNVLLSIRPHVIPRMRTAMFCPQDPQDHAMLSIRQPLMPVVPIQGVNVPVRRASDAQTGDTKPGLRRHSHVEREARTLSVTPIPWPRTMMFLFDQDTLPAEFAPGTDVDDVGIGRAVDRGLKRGGDCARARDVAHRPAELCGCISRK